MGNELAMFREWDERREVDWQLFLLPEHQAFHRYISELNSLYLANPALWEADGTHEGFQWLDCKSDNKCLFGYTRTAAFQTVLALFNFSDREAEMPPFSGVLVVCEN